jgi:hypothetical protein
MISEQPRSFFPKLPKPYAPKEPRPGVHHGTVRLASRLDRYIYFRTICTIVPIFGGYMRPFPPARERNESCWGYVLVPLGPMAPLQQAPHGALARWTTAVITMRVCRGRALPRWRESVAALYLRSHRRRVTAALIPRALVCQLRLCWAANGERERWSGREGPHGSLFAGEGLV